MTNTKKIYTRLGLTDIVLTKEVADKLGKYVQILSKNGTIIDEAELFFVAFEDEDGIECDENGNYFPF